MPHGYALDMDYRARPEADEIQLDLILDYRTDPALYPAFHADFREWQPPFLAVRDETDAHFIPVGAHPYRRDLPNAEIHLLDSGHSKLMGFHGLGARQNRAADRGP